MMIDLANFETTLEAVQDTRSADLAGITTGRRRRPYPPARGRSTGAGAAAGKQGVELINIMHTEVEFVTDSIEAVRRGWDGLIGVYAHSSTEIDKRWCSKM